MYTGEDGVGVCTLRRMGWTCVHWGGWGGWRYVHWGGWVLRMDEVIVHTHGLVDYATELFLVIRSHNHLCYAEFSFVYRSQYLRIEWWSWLRDY